MQCNFAVSGSPIVSGMVKMGHYYMPAYSVLLYKVGMASGRALA